MIDIIIASLFYTVFFAIIIALGLLSLDLAENDHGLLSLLAILGILFIGMVMVLSTTRLDENLRFIW